MIGRNLQPKPKGETDAQRVKRFAATGEPRYLTLEKLWRAGVFPADAETDFYMGRSTIRCWRLKRDVSPQTKQGKVHRFRFVDVTGTSYIPADKDAPAAIRWYFTTRAAKLSARKAAEAQRAEAARVKAYNNRTPAQIAENEKRIAAEGKAWREKEHAKDVRKARKAVADAQATLAALETARPTA